MKNLVIIITIMNIMFVTIMGQDADMQTDDSIPVNSVVNMLNPKVRNKTVFENKLFTNS